MVPRKQRALACLVLFHAAVACGAKESECSDTDTSCGTWKQKGECESNPGFMHVERAPMSKLRPGKARPERRQGDSTSAGGCPRLPQAPASHGRPISWACRASPPFRSLLTQVRALLRHLRDAARARATAQVRRHWRRRPRRGRYHRRHGEAARDARAGGAGARSRVSKPTTTRANATQAATHPTDRSTHRIDH